ncbi:hypothetical protein BDFB_001338 [Asbolus verrucosus]|uniref:Uncharacterized protein n=1 Tax=Asbolus verrucosus TaxID=1661398 RepID=A0A482VJM1_ASBVE|nr:hypothetical protein BDFB_001338 [Asbolus verrucosus]
MYHIYLSVLIFGQVCLGQLRGPPMVEIKPIFLDSFIPASMQIIAHITELMKYDLKPTTGPTTTTTTTMRPTKPHKPGIFAPESPPGPDSYFAKGLSYEEYVHRLKYPSGYNYFDRYRYPVGEEGRSLDEVPQNIDLVLGKDLSDLLRLVNRVEDVEQSGDVDNQVQEFSQTYDDSDFRFLLVRQKKKPPTRAYVTLLSLYDQLNKESKKLGLNKYNGYAQNVLTELAATSTGESADQLRTVLSKIVQRKDTKNPQIMKKINDIIKDLQESSSYLRAALREIPPLQFVL